jgi:hypothetical protein
VIGMTVGDALGSLKRSHDAILVAVLSGGSRFDVNPDASRPILEADDLLVIAPQPFDN